MPAFVSFRNAFLAGGLCLASALVPVTAAENANPRPDADTSLNRYSVPDFTAGGDGWDMINANGTDYAPPLSGAAPVTNDPRWPHVGNLMPGNKTDRIADLSNPILKPWAIEQMKKTNDAVTEGGRTPFVATSLCWPGGVPAQLVVPSPVYFAQTPREVVMIWERDHLVRRVWLNVPHSQNIIPSWYGESVGHYENGDTLVIDTIGLHTHPLSFVDNYRTPHTKDLHVVERWRITRDDKGKMIEVNFVVNDPGAFNTPWGGTMRYRFNNGKMQEVVCNENNPDYFGLDDYEVPEGKKLDF